MIKNRFFALIIALAMLISTVPVLAEDEGTEQESLTSKQKYEQYLTETPHANQIIVKTKDDVSISTIAQTINLRLPRSLVSDDTLSLIPVSEEDMPALLKSLNDNENVIYAQPNYKVNLNEIDSRYWGLQNVGQTANTEQGTEGYDINIIDAWNITQGSADMVVGILDTGIDINHEALADKIWVNPNESINGNDDDLNGYIDDINGWDFVANDNSVYDMDVLDEHGTHVAGIIASIAPNVKLLPLKAFNYNSGYTYDIINAIHYAENLGVKIINCSFASTEYNIALEDAIAESNMLFIAAAGNYGRSTDELAPIPACYESDNVLSVTAIDSTGTLAPFSTYGDKIDVAVPGVNIYSTLPNNSYGYKNGTSMAAAYASGAAALVLSNNAELSASQIRQTIIQSATTSVIMPEGTEDTENLLDVKGALEHELPPEKIPTEFPEMTDAKPSSEPKEPLYPFDFELSNDILTLNTKHKMAYDTVAIRVWGKTESKDAVTLLSEKILSTQTAVPITNWRSDVDYEFAIDFNNAGLVETFLGELKLYYSDEVSETLFDYNVIYHHTYATQEYVGGDFELMATNVNESEPNNAMTTVGSQQIYDDYTVTGNISSSTDVDYYRISFNSAGVVNFWLGVPSGYDYELDLYNSSGVSVDFSHNGTGIAELIQFYAVTAGATYYIKVSKYSTSSYSASAAYTLRVKWYPSPDVWESNDTFATAKLITEANGYLDANINHHEDVDYYKFTLSTYSHVSNVVLSNIPSGTQYNMEIFNAPNDNESSSVYWGYSTATTKSYSGTLAPGTYYVRIYSYNSATYSASNYRLTFTTSPIRSVGLNNSNAHTVNTSNITYYDFTISNNTGLNIYLKNFGSADFDIYIYKLNSGTYTEIGSSKSGSNNFEEINKSLTNGTYRIMVYRYSGSTSYYTIDTTSTTTPDAATLTISDSSSITMTAGQTLTITVRATNTGANVWTSAAGVKLDKLQNSALFTSANITLGSSETIEYGGSKTFSITLTAPSPSTTTPYIAGWRMTRGSVPFGTTVTKSITVTPPTETLTSGSTKTLNGTGEKLYKINVGSSGGTYVFRTLFNSSPSNMDTALTLYSSSMAQLTYNDDIVGYSQGSLYSKIEYNLSSNTDYYLKAAEYYGNPLYCYVKMDSYADTTISIGGNTTLTNQLEGYYKFIVPSGGGTYIVKTEKYSQNSNTVVALLDSSKARITSNNDGTGLGEYSIITRDLSAGTYYIRVANYEYATVGKNKNVYFRIYVSAQTATTPPTQEQSSLSISSPSNNVSVIKLYREDKLRITGLISNVSSVSVTVNNNPATITRKTSTSYEATYTPTSSGTYIIKATATAINGSNPPLVQRTVTLIVNDDGDDFGTASSIKEGTERTVAIDIAGDIDCFEFIPQWDGYYTVHTTGSTDTVVSVYNFLHSLVGYNDDDASKTYVNNGDVAMFFSEGRSYFIYVHHVSSSGTGNYKLVVQNLKDDNENSKNLTIGSSVYGRIDFPGDEDIFVFRPTSSGAYTFKTTGTTDTLGLIYDENGDFMAFNDDGNGTNCSIALSLTANRNYYFAVKHNSVDAYNKGYYAIVQ